MNSTSKPSPSSAGVQLPGAHGSDPLASTIEQYHEKLGDALAEVVRLRLVIGAKQAHIDALMLEHCPDEMTPEQLEEWASHQRPGCDEATLAKALAPIDSDQKGRVL